MTALEFQIRKNDFGQTRLVPQVTAPAGSGELVVRVDRFALTANNITYALYGDIIGYWKFFPAEDDGWGVLPCWGFGEVIDSGCPSIAVGERLFGYWPMASLARLTPNRIEPTFLMEGAAGRRSVDPNFGEVMNAFYNRYVRRAKVAKEAQADEAWQAVLVPLAMTGFMIDDFVASNQAWGARRVILGSASSKTAIATAHFLKNRGGLEVVGLTAHADFARSTGAYDRVESYDAIETLPTSPPSVYIDFSGDNGVTRRVHRRLAGALQKSILVGGTHWHATAPVLDIPPPAPELFFIPAYLAMRLATWGEAMVDERFASAWASLLPIVQRGMTLEFAEGSSALESAYQALLAGNVAPDRAHLLRL